MIKEVTIFLDHAMVPILYNFDLSDERQQFCQFWIKKMGRTLLRPPHS